MYCLDSNIFIALFRGDKDLKGRVELLRPDEISTTSIALSELFKGAFQTSNRDSGISIIKRLAASYQVFPFDADCALIFAEDYAKLEMIGKPTQEKDLMISSIAKLNDLTLITRNIKHFINIPDLKIEEW